LIGITKGESAKRGLAFLVHARAGNHAKRTGQAQELTLKSHSSCEAPHVVLLSQKILQLQIQSAVT
jgi:hypothetical protein